MLREFYSFIAKKINSYFQTAAINGLILPGETFCLKLDKEDMVMEVSDALKELAVEEDNVGVFEHVCDNGYVYTTYTIKLINDEIIIAPQINGMTSDFLCATLRNAANSAQKPILMISSTPIDSAISGSRNMSASGMPFYGEELMKEIRSMVNESTQLTNVEKRLLNFELLRRDADVFSDKASLYEYRDLLAIMSAGKIQRDSFPGFRLFYVAGKTEYQNEGQAVIDKKIRENNFLFERIDRCIRFGNLSTDLAKDFDESFITRIETEQRKDPDGWSRLFSYAEMLAQIEKHKSKVENPLKIDTEDVLIYGTIPFETVPYEDAWILRNEGSQTAKKRTKNIVIFNSKKYSVIHVRFNCNARILNSDIVSEGLSFEKDGKDIIFELTPAGIVFHKIELYDAVNDIRYIFKICLVDLPTSTMLSVIKHSFTIDFRKKKDIRIKLSGIGTDLIFNEGAPEVVSAKVDDGQSYFCAYNQRLHLHSTEEELSNYATGLRTEIDFAGITVPFIMFPDESKSEGIIGRRILRDKYATKRSYEFINEKIYSDSQEYYAKTNLLRELRVEKLFVDNEIMVGSCRHFYDAETAKIKKEDILQNTQLEQAYVGYLNALKTANTIPTLAYLSGDIKEAATAYVDAFIQLYADLEEGKTLSEEQVNALYIGTISVENGEEILCTPLHPINVAYHLSLIDEPAMKEATDVVIERLNSLNLLPYIKRKKIIYKVSDQLNSMEWKYYAPVKNKKYRGSRRFVPKLIEEKITEFLSHFKYIFEDINNKVIKINLINMGDCSEVFTGIAQYFIHAINRNPDVDALVQFELHVYTDNRLENAFSNIREHNMLKQYLVEHKLEIASGTSMNTLEGIFAKNVDCYFHEDTGKAFNYAHLSFYEMESEITPEQASMADIETGVSLNGILSGVPSSKYSSKYRTGFGAKYAPDTKLVNFAKLYNAFEYSV